MRIIRLRLHRFWVPNVARFQLRLCATVRNPEYHPPLLRTLLLPLFYLAFNLFLTSDRGLEFEVGHWRSERVRNLESLVERLQKLGLVLSAEDSREVLVIILLLAIWSGLLRQKVLGCFFLLQMHSFAAFHRCLKHLNGHHSLVCLVERHLSRLPQRRLGLVRLDCWWLLVLEGRQVRHLQLLQSFDPLLVVERFLWSQFTRFLVYGWRDVQTSKWVAPTRRLLFCCSKLLVNWRLRLETIQIYWTVVLLKLRSWREAAEEVRCYLSVWEILGRFCVFERVKILL